MSRAAALLCVLLLAVPVAAEPLTFERCRALARQRSDDMRAQQARTDAARAALAQATGGILPDIRFAATRAWRDTDNDMLPGETAESRFTLSQPLFAGLSRINAARAARVELSAAEALQFETERQLDEQVTTAFFAQARAAADRANIRAIRALMEERSRELRGRVRLGKSRESEALMLESQLASLRAQEEEAEGAHAVAAERMALLTGVPAGDLTVEPAAELAVPDLGSALARTEFRADVRAARLALRAQERRVTAARGGLWPSLDLDASWYTRRAGAYARSEWETLLSLDVPLFRGGTLRGRLAQERARSEELSERLTQAARTAAAEVRMRYQAALSSRRQAGAYAEAYDKARASYDLQLRDYRYGLVNNLDVIQSLNTLLDVKRSWDRARLQAQADAALLRSAAGE